MRESESESERDDRERERERVIEKEILFFLFGKPLDTSFGEKNYPSSFFENWRKKKRFLGKFLKKRESQLLKSLQRSNFASNGQNDDQSF